MAKKARKKSAAKTKNKRKKKSKAAATKKKKLRKARRKTLKNNVAGAYRTVIDTVKGTDQLRNKMEQPGTSETE